MEPEACGPWSYNHILNVPASSLCLFSFVDTSSSMKEDIHNFILASFCMEWLKSVPPELNGKCRFYFSSFFCQIVGICALLLCIFLS